MRRTAWRRGAALFAAALLLLLCGCSDRSSTEVDLSVRDQLSMDFAEDLSLHIIPNRDLKSVQREMGVYVSEFEYVSDYEPVRELARGADANLDCSLTVAFYNTSFVVTRIQFRGGEGYYFRYEYNPFQPDQIELDFRPVLAVSLEEDDYLGKLELTVTHSSRDSAVFTFRLDEGGAFARALSELEDMEET